MKKSNLAEVKEIKQIADKMLKKPVVSNEDLASLSKKLDTVLAQFGVFNRYFKRLS